MILYLFLEICNFCIVLAMKSLFLLVAQALFTSVYSAFYFLVRNTAAFLIISL